MALLLLHQGGWDEVILVAIALVAGVAIVYFTGRKRVGEEDEEESNPTAEMEPPVEPVTAGSDGTPSVRDSA